MRLSVLSTEIIPGDWGQFVPSIIVTVIGMFLSFVASITLVRFIDKVRNVKEARKILINLKKELEQIKTALGKLKGDNYELSPVKTPEWEAANKTGEIKLLSEIKLGKRYLKGLEKASGKAVNADIKNWKRLLFDMYNKVDSFNQWKNLFSNAATEALAIRDELVSVVGAPKDKPSGGYQSDFEAMQQQVEDRKKELINEVPKVIDVLTAVIESKKEKGKAKEKTNTNKGKKRRNK